MHIKILRTFATSSQRYIKSMLRNIKSMHIKILRTFATSSNINFNLALALANNPETQVMTIMTSSFFPLTAILAAVKVISLLVLSSALIDVVTAGPNSCPSGWYHNKGFCYMAVLENEKMSRDAAKKKCVDQGANLASYHKVNITNFSKRDKFIVEMLMRKVIAKKGVPPHTGKAFFHSGLEQKWSDNGKILSCSNADGTPCDFINSMQGDPDTSLSSTTGLELDSPKSDGGKRHEECCFTGMWSKNNQRLSKFRTADKFCEILNIFIDPQGYVCGKKAAG